MAQKNPLVLLNKKGKYSHCNIVMIMLINMHYKFAAVMVSFLR